ncbi:hypothetical protein Abci_046_020 [Acetobacter cibinongensis]|nr:hypothetical protein Abci_046_020 [Acetobacter cibinongensis]
MLSLTAVCPVFISLAYIEFKNGKHTYCYFFLFLFFVVVFFAKCVIKKSKEKLEKIPITITKAKTTDKEVISFCISYALPIIFRANSVSNIETWLVASLILFVVLWTTDAMPANPVLGILGYHFYEVDSGSGVGYVLITKKRISNVQQINQVVQIGEYGILEL